MNPMNSQTAKKLTRVRLVHWHFFKNATIEVDGSWLLSGENSAGKSTVFDAIQLVLTTSTRHFNTAANEKSKRDLKGYVRGKTGEEGNTYLRKKGVISYVALEFYEERKNRFFVIGGRFESPDESSDVKRAWYCVNSSLDGISFIVDGVPATAEQFKFDGEKIKLEYSSKKAREDFKVRLGHLDEKFFEIIPKAIAFKPISNVKDFITQFILPQKNVEVDVLRENIRNLREMQLIIKDVREQIVQLERILEAHNKVSEAGREMLVIDIFLKIAEIEKKKEQIEEYQKKVVINKQDLSLKEDKDKLLEESLSSFRSILNAIRIDLSKNECSQLIDQLKQKIQLLEKDRGIFADGVAVLEAQLSHIIRALPFISDVPANITPAAVNAIKGSTMGMEDRNKLMMALNDLCRESKLSFSDERSEKKRLANNEQDLMKSLTERIDKLKKNEITYPVNTIRLREAIEKEFRGRSVDANVRVFADLIDLVDPEWQNAVEGYLNTQRFNIIVEPRYYDIAANVYDRYKDQIEGVALVNTGKLDLDEVPDEGTLASMVTSNNRYARAYANYLMGRVVLCDSIDELKNHSRAITSGCMLYQGKGLRKIPADVYRIPYIGKAALARQLEICESERRQARIRYDVLLQRIREIDKAIEYIDKPNFGFIGKYLNTPVYLEENDSQIRVARIELRDAESDPNIIALREKEQNCEAKIKELEAARLNLSEKIGELKKDTETCKDEAEKLMAALGDAEGQIHALSNGDELAVNAAQQKYKEWSKSREAGSNYDGYARRKNTLFNQRNRYHDELISLQTTYKSGEFGTGSGEEEMAAYRDEYRRLSTHNLIEYEEKLGKAREDCELEFRENFLARMRENIESAEDIFKELNRSLRDIAYGNDFYKFHCLASREKQGLYEMITSEINIGGFTLFSNEFGSRYHNEMETLFARLTESDEVGENILSEYTDYREYLDYDIEIISRDGKSQYFSKVYGEKSGGETQTPYYIAIAASFAQLYSVGETVRIIMLDEAFDKMDDDRIASMMQFFRAQNFQVLLATPPGKIEVIGEYVDTVSLVFREGYCSYVEAYNL